MRSFTVRGAEGGAASSPAFRNQHNGRRSSKIEGTEESRIDGVAIVDSQQRVSSAGARATLPREVEASPGRSSTSPAGPSTRSLAESLRRDDAAVCPPERRQSAGFDGKSARRQRRRNARATARSFFIRADPALRTCPPTACRQRFVSGLLGDSFRAGCHQRRARTFGRLEASAVGVEQVHDGARRALRRQHPNSCDFVNLYPASSTVGPSGMARRFGAPLQYTHPPAAICGATEPMPASTLHRRRPGPNAAARRLCTTRAPTHAVRWLRNLGGECGMSHPRQP